MPVIRTVSFDSLQQMLLVLGLNLAVARNEYTQSYPVLTTTSLQFASVSHRILPSARQALIFQSMGCITSRITKNKEIAYRSELGNPLLKKLKPSLPPDSVVVVIRLKCLKDLQPPSQNLSGSADPFVEMKMLPDDAVAGDQFQRSSCKPATINPSWIPDERFQFIVSGSMTGKIVFSVYSFRPALAPIPMADAVINLKDIDVTIKSQPKQLRLISPETGKPCGTAYILLEVLNLNEALSTQEQNVFQYERWRPIILWGSTKPGHLLVTDPGAWSSVDGKQYFTTLEEAAGVPTGWAVSKHWYSMATDDDADGWCYALNFKDINWYSKPESELMVVRRRAWRRELVLVDPRNSTDATSSPVPKDSTS